MAITKDIDSQPLSQAFSFARQKQKAMYGLKGVLAGIVADRRLNEKELLYLDTWLKSQEFLNQDEDVVHILALVGSILEDGKITLSDLGKMRQDIEAVINAKSDIKDSSVFSNIQQLLGFLTGIASDGVLNDDEITALQDWLDSNESIKSVWPASVVVTRLAVILEDGIITDEEREDLMATVDHITGTEGQKIEFDYESPTAAWEDQVDELTIDGSTFCLTGEFVSGDRLAVSTLLHCQGGKTQSNVNKSVDYLVIGTLASQDWLYSSHGRKIEKAFLIRREGSPIKIITERTLLKFAHQAQAVA